MSISRSETVEATIRRLETRIANLQEEIRQRDAAFGPPGTLPMSLGLTLAEDAALSSLRNRYPGDVSAEALILRCWGAQSEASPDTVTRFITALKRKLAPAGIEIVGLPGIGYKLGQDGAAKIDALREQARRELKDAKPPTIRRQPFTPREDEIIREAWTAGVIAPEIVKLLTAAAFPIRRPVHVSRRAGELGLDDRKSDPWTPEEDEILRRGRKLKRTYPKIKNMLSAKGHRRTINSIQRRCLNLGIGVRPGRMIPEEVSIVAAVFHAGGDARAAHKALAERGFVRSVHTVEQRRVAILGVTREDPWSERRIGILKDGLAAKKSIPSIARQLGLSATPVYRKARLLGYSGIQSTWTEAKFQRLREGAAKGERLVDIAAEIGERYDKTAAMSRRMGLSFGPPRYDLRKNKMQMAAE